MTLDLMITIAIIACGAYWMGQKMGKRPTSQPDGKAQIDCAASDRARDIEPH